MQHLKTRVGKEYQDKLATYGQEVQNLKERLDDTTARARAGEADAKMAAVQAKADLDIARSHMAQMQKETTTQLSAADAAAHAKLQAATELAKAKMDAAEKEISGLQTTVSVQKGQLAGISSGQQQIQERFNEAQVKLAEANARIHLGRRKPRLR